MIGHSSRALLAALLPLTLTLAACQSGPGATAPAATATTQAPLNVAAYKLGSGDRVKITVFRHDDLSGEFALDGAGNFNMPLAGEIQADGLTTPQLEKRIEQKLSPDYIVDAQVGVEVLNYRPFYILGEVTKPGSYPYVNGMNVMNAAALAGGFTYRAKTNSFSVQHGGSAAPPVEVAGNSPILPGDVITVNERWF